MRISIRVYTVVYEYMPSVPAGKRPEARVERDCHWLDAPIAVLHERGERERRVVCASGIPASVHTSTR